MTTPLLLALAVLLTASASEGTIPPEPAADVAIATAPRAASVLAHDLDVRIDGAGRVTEVQRWVVRIDDPAALPDALVAPPGLDGAEDGGARVVDGRLVLPGDVAAGDTFTLTATGGDRRRGAHAGGFRTSPDLPTAAASVTVRGPSWLPLSVWSDARGVRSVDGGQWRTVAVRWEPGDAPAELAWSTHGGWDDAADALVREVDRRVTKAHELGRDAASSLRGASAGRIAARTFQTIALTGPGDFPDARSADEVAASGAGTAAERAVVLLSLLRSQGHEAWPARFRPADAGIAAPPHLVAPELLDRPAVAVKTERGLAWIDPAAPRLSYPELPASMVGAVAWIPGDLPVRLGHGATDGVVRITGSVSLATAGEAPWSATVTASGVAAERLRDHLAAAPDARDAQLLALARAGRPGIEAVRVTASGLEDAREPLEIRIQGRAAVDLAPFGPGRRGTVAPLLAPALAAALPPNLQIREELAIEAPTTLTPLHVTRPGTEASRDAIVSWDVVREVDRIVVVTEAERPYRRTSASRDAAARALLHDVARRGPELTLTPAPSPSAARAWQQADASPADAAALAARTWRRAGSARKADKLLARTAERHGFEAVADALSRWGAPDDSAPWQALFDAAEQDTDRVVALGGLVRTGATATWSAEDWRALTGSFDRGARLQAQVALLEAMDAAGVDPGEQLAAAEALARSEGDDEALSRVLTVKARALLAREPALAITALDEALTRSPTPRARMLRAEAGARAGEPTSRIRAEVARALDADPRDPALLDGAARTLEAAGRPDEAFRYARLAARVTFSDPTRWDRLSELALRHGDLPVALDAARRASALAPDRRDLADDLVRIATLARDEGAVSVGKGRGGRGPGPDTWPPSIGQLMTWAPQDGLLAVLVHHDAEVVRDPRLLALRAKLQLQAGRLDDAARDGVLLATRHDTPQGWAFAFAASTGRMVSSPIDAALDDAARTDPVARTARMEHRLLTGGDAFSDAKRLRGDDRADLIYRAAVRPSDMAQEAKGWAADVPTPRWRAPRGYAGNAVLSSIPGVTAWSDPRAGHTVLRVGPANALLPPPLSLLYDVVDPPVAELPDDGRIVRLSGGVLPAFAAIRRLGDERVIGLAHTAEEAARAAEIGAE